MFLILLSRSFSWYMGELQTVSEQVREENSNRQRTQSPAQMLSTPLLHARHGFASILWVQGILSSVSVFVHCSGSTFI